MNRQNSPIPPAIPHRRALLAASCHEPVKLMAQSFALRRLAGSLDWDDATKAGGVTDADVDVLVPLIIGNRTPAHMLRGVDDRLHACVGHLMRKERITQGDLSKLHSIVAADAPPGIRRGYVKIDGVDAATATFVPPPPSKLGAYFKDIVASFDPSASAGLGLLHPVAVAAQMIMVHPFADGNGRMSRAAFFVAGRRCDPRTMLDAARCLWANGNERMYAICNHVIDFGWSDEAVFRLLDRLFPFLGKDSGVAT